MTEISSSYDVAPNRCQCDADWRILYESGGHLLIQCVQCGEWIMTFEAVARWNQARAEIERLRAELANALDARQKFADNLRQTERDYADMVVDYERQCCELRAELAALQTRYCETCAFEAWNAGWVCHSTDSSVGAIAHHGQMVCKYWQSRQADGTRPTDNTTRNR